MRLWKPDITHKFPLFCWFSEYFQLIMKIV